MATNSKSYNAMHYMEYRGKKSEIMKRSNRNKARRIYEKKGKVTKGDGKEIDHKSGNALNNKKSNLRILSRKKNRQLGAKKANKNKGRGYKKRESLYV